MFVWPRDTSIEYGIPSASAVACSSSKIRGWIDGPRMIAGAAAEPVVALVLGVAAADVGRVGDVDRDRDRRLQLERGGARTGEVAHLFLDDRDAGDLARSTALRRDPARDLERDVRAEPVVERAGRDAAVPQLERLARDERRVADPDERARLVGAPRAEVEVEIVELERLPLLASLPLLLARPDDCRARALPSS